MAQPIGLPDLDFVKSSATTGMGEIETQALRPPEVPELEFTKTVDTTSKKLDTMDIADAFIDSEFRGKEMPASLEANRDAKSNRIDIENRGYFQSVKAAWDISMANSRVYELRHRQLSGDLDPAYENEIRLAEEKINALMPHVDDKGLLNYMSVAAAELMPSILGGVKQGLTRGMQGGMLAGGVTAVTAPFLAIPATVAGFTAGMMTGGAEYAYVIESGSAFNEMLKLEDSNGNKLNPDIIRAVSHSIGAINAVLESAKIGTVVKAIPGVKQALSRVLKKATAKTLAGEGLKNILVTNAKNYGTFVATETTLEIMQQVNSDLLQNVAIEFNNEVLGSTIDTKTADILLNNIKETAKKSIAGFSVLGAVSFSGNTIIDSRSRVKKPGLKKVLPPDKSTNPSTEVTQTYERSRELFFQERDERLLLNKSDVSDLRSELKVLATNQNLDEVDIAVQLYLDSKNDPKVVHDAIQAGRGTETIASKLSETQIKLLEMSQNLTKEQKAFANKIGTRYTELGLEGLNDDVLFDLQDHYVSRSWIVDGTKSNESIGFARTTKHARERQYNTIVEGWIDGMEMVSHKSTENLQNYRDSMIRVIEQKRLMQALLEAKDENGEAVLSTEALKGYTRLKGQAFTHWGLAGKAPKAMADNIRTHKNRLYVDETKGAILAKTPLFAPKAIARDINNVFGISALKNIESPTGKNALETLSKANFIMKTVALSTSFFHNIAFLRSFYLGGHKTVRWGTLNPFTAHREGVRMIKNLDSTVRLGVRNGLTLDIIQDWQTDLFKKESDIKRIAEKGSFSSVAKSLTMELWKRHVNFTFGIQGSGLKVKAFMNELKAHREKFPNLSENEAAAQVAKLINEDFGGLHLERMGRNPTLQHIFHLVALAPDWTESNIRTVLGVFDKSTSVEQRSLYQKFWARIIYKTAIATGLANLVLAGGDPEDAYKKWKSGVGKKWTNIGAVDITPIYKAFGRPTGQRKYFSVAGHFLDPVKYAVSGVVGSGEAARHKMSLLGRASTDWLFSHNWQGKRFKSLTELEHDINKTVDLIVPGSYVTFKPKHRGVQLDKPGFADEFEWPAYIMHTILSSSPVAFQNFLAAVSGEADYLDSIFSTLGMKVSGSHKKPI